MQRFTYFLAAIAFFGSLLFFAWTDNDSGQYIKNADRSGHLRQLLSVAKFTDPKSVADRPSKRKPNFWKGKGPRFEFDVTESLIDNRANCQVVYVMGVEGATHHGFMPVLEALAKHQVDPVKKVEYVVDVNSKPLKAGLYGWYSNLQKDWGFKGGNIPPIDDPDLVRSVVQSSCPMDGKKHVLIEWQSFPSGQENDRRSYRVHRQHEWLSMTPQEIATSDEAMSHPANMTAFVEAYSPYAEIRFVVLSRPFMETIASHHEWDEGPLVHSNVIRGFSLMLRRFLDVHEFDGVDGRRSWTMVCVERVMAKFYKRDEDVSMARANIIAYLANFLGWPVEECPHCFDKWHDSTKDPLKVLGKSGLPTMNKLYEHMGILEGVWPPPGEEGVEEQQCRL